MNAHRDFWLNTVRYYDMRMVKNMGGIGAHHDADYDTLKRFVEDPWMCKETMQARGSGNKLVRRISWLLEVDLVSFA